MMMMMISLLKFSKLQLPNCLVLVKKKKKKFIILELSLSFKISKIINEK